jgi:hypothetical protein
MRLRNSIARHASRNPSSEATGPSAPTETLSHDLGQVTCTGEKEKSQANEIIRKIRCGTVCPFYAPVELGERIEYWTRHLNLEFTKDDRPLASTPYTSSLRASIASQLEHSQPRGSVCPQVPPTHSPKLKSWQGTWESGEHLPSFYLRTGNPLPK